MGFWESGTMTYGMCVVIANLKILMFSNLFNALNVSIMMLSFITYLISLVIISEIKVSEVYYLFDRFNLTFFLNFITTVQFYNIITLFKKIL